MQSTQNSSSSVSKSQQSYPHSKLHHELSSVSSTQQSMSESSSGI